jgi:hypothetical protein
VDLLTRLSENLEPGKMPGLKRLTKALTDQEKIELVESWGWDVQTDGSEEEQVCVYTGIMTQPKGKSTGISDSPPSRSDSETPPSGGGIDEDIVRPSF